MIGASHSTRLGPISDKVRAFRIEDDLGYAREMVEATREDLLEAFKIAIKTLSDVVGDERRLGDVAKLREVGLSVGSGLLENSNSCTDAMQMLEMAERVRSNPELWVQRKPGQTALPRATALETIKPKKSSGSSKSPVKRGSGCRKSPKSQFL